MKTDRVETIRRTIRYNKNVSYTNDIYVDGHLHINSVGDKILPKILKTVIETYGK